ncbi:MAG TPA: alpha/beta fold hydrolase [Chitinophagaceae bacterium]|nr:alpha/beta fold hydrolase [Chitinophagaceae bacterium]
MEWLVGTWQGFADGQPFYEHWEKVNDKEYNNINFSLCTGDTVIDSRSKIEIKNKKIVYSSGQNIWELKEIDDAKMIFENDQNKETFTFSKTAGGEWNAVLKSPQATLNYTLRRTAPIGELLNTKAEFLEGRYRGDLEFNNKKLSTSIHFFVENDRQKATASTPANLQLDQPFNSVCYNPPFVKLTLQDGTRILQLNAKLEGDKITGKLAGEIPATLALSKQEKPIAVPETYIVEKVKIKNGDMVLDGNLFLPKGIGPFGALIMIAGSGNHIKEEYNGWADLLASKGVAVLIYDKRNVTNTSNLTIRQRTSDVVLPGQLEGDILAAVSLLKSRKDIRSIGLFGFSQGAVLAPIVAANNNDISFLVAVSGNVTTDKEFIINQSLTRLRQRNFSEAQISRANNIMERLFDYVKTKKDGGEIQRQIDKAYEEGFGQYTLPRYLPNDDEIRYLSTWNSFEHDPAEFYGKINIPVYAVFGADDWVIPVERSIQILNETYSRKQHLLTLKVYTGSDHFIKNMPPRDDFDFPKFAPNYINHLAEWIVEQSQRR